MDRGQMKHSRLSSIRPQYDGVPLQRVLILVDYSNLLYRSWFSSIVGLQERPWLPITRFIDSLRLCAQRSKVDGIPLEFIFAGESRIKLDRTEIDPTYKSQRKTVLDPAFRYFRQIMAALVSDMGFHILSRDGAEADDVIASIVAKVCHECKCKVPCEECKCDQNYSTDAVIFSNDRDLYQLLSYKRCVIFKSHGVFYTDQNFIDEFGFQPAKYESYKAMIGDKSDNIKGVDGFGPVKARQYILEERIPIETSYAKAMALVQLDNSLQVPSEGEKYTRTSNYMLEAIKSLVGPADGRETMFDEIMLSINKLGEVCL